MHTLTIKEIDELLDKVQSKQDIIKILNKLSAESEGKKSVLFSGIGENEEDLKNAIEKFYNDKNFRMINKTQAAKFLDIDNEKSVKFREALERVFNTTRDPSFDVIKEYRKRGSELNKFFYDVGKKDSGLWDITSRRFASEIKGEIVTAIGKDAQVERTFYQTELPELLKNKNITKINGMDKADFASKLNSYATDREKLNFIISDRKTVLEITGKSDLYELNQKDFETARKNIKYNEILHTKTKDLIAYQNQKASGNTEHTTGNKKPADTPIAIGDNEKKIDKITREIVNNEKMSYSDKIKEITKVLKNEPPAKVIGTLNKIGTAGLVLSAGWVSYEAYKALEEGDAQRASDLIGEYSVSLGGGYLTAAAAMALMGGTVTVGSLLIGMAAMAVGSKLFSYLYENRDALLYFIDPFDENWKGRDQEWLEEFKNFWQDPNRWENAKDTLPYLVEQFNHTLQNAINSIGQFLGSIFNFLIYDPLALDLNGDGKIGISPAPNGGAYFDHNGDGVSHRSSWISKEDVILAYDRNGNGKIDGGGELLENLVA